MEGLINLFSLNYKIFSIAGQGISLVEFISVVLGLICVFLAGRNNKNNFWFGYIYNIFLCILFAQMHLYSVMLLQPISFAINAFGHWRWSHPKKEEESSKGDKSLKVSNLSLFALLTHTIVFAIATLIWYFVLKNLGVNWFKGIFEVDPSPLLDSAMLMLTLMALYLSAEKKWECWIVWIFVNIFNMVLYIKNGLIFMPIVSFIYLVNGIWALYSWYLSYKKEQ